MIASIDIGTSYSSISMLGPDGKILPVDISTGVSMFGSKYSLPSAVFVEDNGELLLGQAAINSRIRKPQNYRDEFKRNLGESVPIFLGNRSFLPEDLYTEFFQYMKACAEKVSGEKIELVYLTCPASYGRSKKDKIISAVNAAGLFNLELVDEPTAAAMSYCAEGFVQDKQNLLVYDFGGGTFDVSLIRYENGEFQPLTDALGLERCGGIDIDRLIFQDMMSKVDPATLGMLQENNLHYMRFMTQLSELAVKCKHHLSSADQFSEDIVVGFDYIPYSLTIDRYNQMIAGLVGQTIHTCRQIMENAKLKMSDLNAVLLVGGTSRVRLVREMVEQMAGKIPVYCAADLELAVSQGALNYRNYKKPEPEPDAEGWYQKGIQYEKEENPQKAVSCYHKAAEMGNMNGQYSLALCYQAAYGVEESDEQAVFWYIKAAEQGHADSQYALGICYLSGLGVQKNVVEARRWLEKASEQDHMEAIFELHKLDSNSRKTLENNKKEEKTAGQEDKKAHKTYTNDVPDETSAERLLEAGNKSYSERNYKTAVTYYCKAAEMGSSAAQFKLGMLYSEGTNVKLDRKEAIKWFTKAAEQNHSIALFNLAGILYNAEGEDRDEEKACNYLERLAHGENINDYYGGKANRYLQYISEKNTRNYSISEIMMLAREFKKDRWHGCALECYLKAAHAGNAEAQYEVGEAYRYGKGTSVSDTLSKAWYQKAATQGHKGAISKVGKKPSVQRQKGLLESAFDWLLGI